MEVSGGYGLFWHLTTCHLTLVSSLTNPCHGCNYFSWRRFWSRNIDKSYKTGLSHEMMALTTSWLSATEALETYIFNISLRVKCKPPKLFSTNLGICVDISGSTLSGYRKVRSLVKQIYFPCAPTFESQQEISPSCFIIPSLKLRKTFETQLLPLRFCIRIPKKLDMCFPNWFLIALDNAVLLC